MGSIAFGPGQGTVIMDDADGNLNNSTSTKQNVSPTTGLVVLASSGKQVYFHQYFSLGGGGGGGTSPTAAFSATPTSGPAPLTVQFTDQSSGGPTAWQWDFQNDGTVDSTQQNPSFAFESPGTYSVKLTVSNVSGEDTTTKSGYITVATAGPTLTFTPTDDAFVRSNFPDENTGSLDNLRSFKKSRRDRLLSQVHRFSGNRLRDVGQAQALRRRRKCERRDPVLGRRHVVERERDHVEHEAVCFRAHWAGREGDTRNVDRDRPRLRHQRERHV